SIGGQASILAASALVAGREDFLCHVVDTATGRLVGTMEGIAGAANRSVTGLFFPTDLFLEFTADGRLVLGMRDPSGNNVLAVWDASLGQMQRIHENHQPLLLSPDDRRVFAKTREGYVFIDLTTGQSYPVALPSDLQLQRM